MLRTGVLLCYLYNRKYAQKEGNRYAATKSVKVKSRSYLLFLVLAKKYYKEVMPLKKKQPNLKVTTVGEPDISKMSESEQKAFYVAMLMRILDKRRKQLEEQSSVNAQKDNAVPKL